MQGACYTPPSPPSPPSLQVSGPEHPPSPPPSLRRRTPITRPIGPCAGRCAVRHGSAESPAGPPSFSARNRLVARGSHELVIRCVSMCSRAEPWPGPTSSPRPSSWPTSTARGGHCPVGRPIEGAALADVGGLRRNRLCAGRSWPETGSRVLARVDGPGRAGGRRRRPRGGRAGPRVARDVNRYTRGRRRKRARTRPRCLISRSTGSAGSMTRVAGHPDPSVPPPLLPDDCTAPVSVADTGSPS